MLCVCDAKSSNPTLAAKNAARMGHLLEKSFEVGLTYYFSDLDALTTPQDARETFCYSDLGGAPGGGVPPCIPCSCSGGGTNAAGMAWPR